MGSRKLSTALLALLLTSIPPGFAKEFGAPPPCSQKKLSSSESNRR